MNIQEAAQLAAQTGEAIYREKGEPPYVCIIPTNVAGGCILTRDDPNRYRPGWRWQPGLDDLIADDWCVTGITDRRWATESILK